MPLDLKPLAGRSIAALDLGSGTIKLNVFSIADAGKASPLELHEIDTQLRRGMGEALLLQKEPVADTLRAAAVLKRRAAEFEPASLGVYATSAVRRAANPEMLLEALEEELGLPALVLSEADEGRLNLLGALLSSPSRPMAAVDPGGDSTDCAWTAGDDWQTAGYVSLPFGSVALMEQFQQGAPEDKIPDAVLQRVRKHVAGLLEGLPAAAALKGMTPTIRMNEPMRRCIGETCRSAQAMHFDAAAAMQTALKLGEMDHAGRVVALKGEPEGKVDRTPYGYASWAGLMDFMDATVFDVDLWGIKLGAAVAAAMNMGPWKEE